MHGYWDIDRSTSHCVTFVEAEEVDEELSELVGRVRQNGLRIAYVDCAKFKECPWEILSEIGFQLKTDHPPYHADELRLVRWLDDLIALAYRTSGVVIVLDNAGEAFVESRRHMTELMGIPRAGTSLAGTEGTVSPVFPDVTASLSSQAVRW